MREEEKKRTSLQRFFRKRWVFPAIYLLSAAVVLTAVLWYQASTNDVKDQLSDGGNETQTDTNDALEVSKSVENVNMPVQSPESVSVITKFYEADASQEDKEAALVNYNNQYSLSKGIDLADKDGKEFEVTASLSGTVTTVTKDPVLGHVVEIEHDDGLSTVYQSLSTVSVAQGDKIEQNQVIGASGKNLYNEAAGNHVHFEIRKDGVALNPQDFINKPVTSIKEVSTDQASEEAKEQPAKEPAPAKEDTEQKGGAEKGSEGQSGTKDSSQIEQDSSES
jgi:stage II sporulation protein Q